MCLEQEVTKIIIDYATEYNELEEKYMQKRIEEEEKIKLQVDEEEYPYAKRTDWFEEFSREFNPIWDKYITDKKRVYGGVNRKSIGYPRKYKGIEVGKITSKVTIKTKNKVEVSIVTEGDFYNEYLFILIKKSVIWKIDSYKQRSSGHSKWNNQIL